MKWEFTKNDYNDISGVCCLLFLFFSVALLVTNVYAHYTFYTHSGSYSIGSIEQKAQEGSGKNPVFFFSINDTGSERLYSAPAVLMNKRHFDSVTVGNSYEYSYQNGEILFADSLDPKNRAPVFRLSTLICFLIIDFILFIIYRRTKSQRQ